MILVTGANGQVGHELTLQREYAGQVLRCLPREQFDITDPDMVNARMAELKPALVINAAAYTAVDRAETEAEQAFAVNRYGVALLAEACSRHAVPLLHISTDYVFDGRQKNAYREDAPVNPAGIYGKSKLAGEMEIRQRLEKHIILRTSWVFGAHGHNFVKTMLRLGRERRELKIVNDQFGGPTAAADIAEALLRIGQKILSEKNIPWGTYHFSGAPDTTWYRFAEEIFRQARKSGYQPPNLEPITSDEYPTPAKRPTNSALDCGKIERNFGITRPDWKRGLARVLDVIS
jgi:dTDP-4-dehydrorhamnose reductase